MDRLKHLIVLLVLINTQFISAQIFSVDETVFVHTNNTAFVTGETLFYKIYCLKSIDKKPSVISKIAYIELVDNNKKSIFKTKIALENAIGQGDYFIPTTLKTGSYKLIGYTKWMLNKPVSELFQIDINIINPYKTKEKATSESVLTTATQNQNNIVNENIRLKINKKIFSNRELVDLKIESSNPIFQDASYSLSVRKLDNIPSKNQISAVDFAVKTNYPFILDLQNLHKKIVLPELRGEIISGKIAAKNNTDKIENLTIALSIPGRSFAFKVVETDKNGNFIFNINKIYYTKDIVVQIIDEKADNYNLTIDNEPEIDYSNLSYEPNSKLSYAVKDNLLSRSISSQIENAYYHKKADTITKDQTHETFYYRGAKEYVLDDYTRFKTLKETITEVLTEVYQKQKDNKLYLHVNDPSVFPQLTVPALVLVDGLYLENQTELSKYNMKNVYKIDIIVGRYYVGAKTFNGLISFITFDMDFKSSDNGSSIAKPTILRPQPKKNYNRIDYSKLTDIARIPDFRNQLFWNPDVKLNRQSNNTFYTSDVTGKFEITLEGFTEQGIPISLKENFEVQ